LMSDDEVVVIDDTSISIGYTVHTVFADLNSGNAELVTGVTPPNDWVGRRYLYDSGTWTQNPEWVQPALMPKGYHEASN
jgi:hypothetical protein